MQRTYMEDPNVGFCDPFDDLKGYRECVPNEPHANIMSFTATKPGYLVVTISADSRWQVGDYDSNGLPGVEFVAGNIGPRLRQDGFPFMEVTAKVAGTDESSTYKAFGPAAKAPIHRAAWGVAM